jgi:hypothetical protein
LPVNLVEAGFSQIAKLQTADPNVDLTSENIDTCDNPTFVEGQPNTNYLATIAPLPPSCDQQGAGPCAAGVTPNGIGNTPTSSGTYPGTAAAKGASGSAAQATGSTGGKGSSGSSGGGATSAGGTGAAGAAAGTSSGSSGSGSGPASGSSSSAGSQTPPVDSVDLPLLSDTSFWARAEPYAVALLLLIFAIPAVIGFRRSRLRRGPGR